MKKAVLRLLVLGFVIGVTASLTACNTARGFGEDMESAGRAISDTF